MSTIVINAGIGKKEKKHKTIFLATQSLVAKIKSIAKENELTQSDFIRLAIEDKVKEIEKKKIEEEIKEACENSRAFNKKFSSEWAQFETRI